MKKLLFNSIPLLLIGLVSQSVHAQDSKTNEYRLDKVYSINPQGTLDMKSEDADVTIVGSDRSDVHIKVYRSVHYKLKVNHEPEEFGISVTNVNGNIIFRENRKRHDNRGFSISEKTYTIEIELPKSASIKLEGEDDDYYVSNIDGEIDVEVEDGDIDLKNCNSRSFHFVVEDGDIKIDGASGKIYAVLEDGDIRGRNCSFSDIDIQAEDGDISLETGIQNEGRYLFDTEDGDISLTITKGGGEIDIRHDDGHVRASDGFNISFADESRHKMTLPGGSGKILVRTSDGNVALRKH